ncbi:hypothetical protein QP371_06675 [Gardnerella swidsinskii]
MLTNRKAVKIYTSTDIYENVRREAYEKHESMSFIVSKILSEYYSSLARKKALQKAKDTTAIEPKHPSLKPYRPKSAQSSINNGNKFGFNEFEESI